LRLAGGCSARSGRAVPVGCEEEGNVNEAILHSMTESEWMHVEETEQRPWPT